MKPCLVKEKNTKKLVISSVFLDFIYGYGFVGFGCREGNREAEPST